MKHSDFLESLKTLKSHLFTQQHKQKLFTYPSEKPSTKTYCCCKDSNGEHKYLYHSQKEIEYLLASKHISLQSYPCPYEKGWHLTKN